jgi:hypothetical protein
MSLTPRSGRNTSFNFPARFLGAFAALVASGSAGFAYDINEAISASAGVSYPVSPSPTNPVVQIETFDPGTGQPISFSISATANLPMAYNVEALVGQSMQVESLTPAMVQISNNTGSISGTSTGFLSYTGAPGAYPDQISNGALRIIGGPGFYNASGTSPLTQAIGGDVTWTHTGTISVQGYGVYVSSGSLHAETGWIASGSLNPAGFRTAELSGIVAFSYGDQATGHGHTWPGGNVSVTSSGVIQMTNDSPSQITAGISAGTTTGPGSAYPDPAGGPPTVTVTLDGGQIENYADAAIGIMATASGAQFLNGHDGDGDTAFGGNVSVNLIGNSSITQPGANGVGVFAVSEVYVVSDTPKDSTVQSGTVGVNIGEGSSITTGTTGSVLSIGVLAVGAGSDLFLSPFTSQQVNGHGIGNAGEVGIVNSGVVSTEGRLSAGLVALSIGGAGIVTTNSGTTPDSYLGNSGGATSGTGSAVSVTNNGTVTTVGENAYGIVALSSGGGGLINNEVELVAEAGVATSGLVLGNNTSSSSGSASDGGAISVLNYGTITTGDGLGGGAASAGIVAQSIGGGGGNAGGNHAALFVGDKGGMGGNGGEVNVGLSTDSQLTTKDENSIGVLAQSIGGGGGNGGNAAGLFVAVGGKGGKGGHGGTVNVGVNGNLNTLDDHSSGVIAQSIGGGGGHGGAATAIGVGAAFGLGGNGGDGGNGGTVTTVLYTGGTVATLGNNSAGLHAQSIGGGGGTGGASITRSANLNTGEGFSFDINLAIGGSGGNGGSGGTVSGTNGGIITTGVAFSSTNGAPNMDGADSIGMIAQSIGGGGGHGGLASAKSLALTTGTSSGGGGSDDPANDDSTLTITIGGNVSVSGGGGNGNNGGLATLTNLETVTTWGDGSHGMLAQSIGGGGGNGGDSTAASTLSARSGKGVALNMGLGGSGGTGGDGGGVIMTNSAATSRIETYGQNAAGMVAQSIGGGGGNATVGNSGTSNLHTPVTGSNSATTLAISFDLGGSGGDGGKAGFAEVGNAGNIVTAGSGGQGILAQAIGGGGGNASGGVADGSNNKVTFDLAIGGNGGKGGSASGTNSLGYSVMVTNSGLIHTTGGDATGVLAQSIGGGGGNGGSSDASAGIGKLGSLTNLAFSSTSYQANLTLGAAIGGDGGGGGAGGTVFVNQSGVLKTEGFQSYGILAQSISGGGGKGGTAHASANAGLLDVYDLTVQFGAIVAVGGAGGDAHNSGAVTVNVAGETSTLGYGAHAVVAQSIAGGGGVGADGTADISTSLGLGASVGNVSGTMGDAGNVIVNQTANISTAGSDSVGILGQSIAGGGGIASSGENRERPLVVGAGVIPLHFDLTMGINLHSDDDANGGTVTINSGTAGESYARQITTEGDFSHGIVAQTIGAGGGKSSAIMGSDSNAYADFSTTVTRNISGTLVTSGQQITLGAADGHGSGGTVNLTVAGTEISTGTSGSGYAAYGVLAQSIGGGGGVATVDSAAANGTINLGSTGTASGVGGHGGVVNFNPSSGSVTTQGDSAHGIVLQSIGGGGGVASVGSSRTFSGTAPSGLAVNMNLGSRDAFGTGNNVTGTTSMFIQTSGDHAFGLVAQSIGGGGGIATSQQSGTVTLGMLHATGTFSNFDGRDVSLSLVRAANSYIQTSGVGSHGVVAQSIGGGGGIANPSSTGGLSTAPTAGTNLALGYGGNVGLDIASDILTTGSGAYGVVAQTISGGGGLSGSFAGATGGAGSSGTQQENVTAGNVTITQRGGSLISASGAGASGIFAQNVTSGTHGMGNVQLTVGGSVVGGSGTNAYGIWVDGGNAANSLVVNAGGSVSAASKFAINYTGYTGLNISNSGTVGGAVTLYGSNGLLTGSGTFTNNSGGTYFAEGDVRAQIANSGRFAVGVDGDSAAVATLYDSYSTQDSSLASLDFDAFSSAEGGYDQIVFAGNASGEFLGNITVNFGEGSQVGLGDTFYLINPGGSLENDYLFSSFTVSWNGESVTSGVAMDILVGGVTFSFSTVPADEEFGDSYVLTIVGVPEPGVAMLVLFGLGGLLVRRSRAAGAIR